MTTAVFKFRAVSSDGTLKRGSVDATDEASARARVSELGFVPLSLTKSVSRSHVSRLSTTDLATGLRILANLVGAGLPVARALRAFENLAPRSWKIALPTVQERVKSGTSLATALAEAPLGIPALVVGIIRAGEAGAGLAAGLSQAAEIAESSASMRSSLRAALVYPAVVASAGLGAIGILVGVVIPRFSAILADFDQQLPATTRAVLRLSELGRAALFPSIGTAIAVAIAWSLWVSSETGRRQWHNLLMRLPGIGPLRHAVASSRLCIALSALLRSGVPVSHALQFAGPASGDSEIENRTRTARTLVAAGSGLAHALEETGAATTTAIRFVRAGEDAGNVAEMLAHAGAMERDGVERTMRAAVRLLEPILLLVLAGVVALVAAALLQAVYSIRPTA